MSNLKNLMVPPSPPPVACLTGFRREASALDWVPSKYFWVKEAHMAPYTEPDYAFGMILPRFIFAQR